MGCRRLHIFFLAAALAVLAAACTLPPTPEPPPPPPPPSPPKQEIQQPEAEAHPVPQIREEEGLTTVQIVRKLAPSIVRVETETEQRRRRQPSDAEAGVGTGVIFSREGYVITNDHVIAEALRPVDRITVTLLDQRTFYAEIVGRDRPTDLAVLKIDAPGLSPAEFSRPAELQVGQDVVAIGFALDMLGAPTVTRGVISALHRAIHGPLFTIPDAIQTDAGINLGNSGGPLVNARGEVIGINNASIREAQQVGFAISVNIVRPVIDAILQDGRVRRAYLGVSTREVELRLARRFKLPVARGIAVIYVEKDSPAEKAGLRPQDVILRVAGQSVSNHGELLAILFKHKSGDRIRIDYYREAQSQSAEAELTDPPGSQ